MGRLFVLVAMGFGLGLIFGVVMEEPELLAGHLRGESEAVRVLAEPEFARGVAVEDPGAWSDRASPAEEPGEVRERALLVEEAREEVAAETSGLPDVAARRMEAAPAPEEPSFPPSDPKASVESGTSDTDAASRWAIQVGAFAEEAAARGVAESLRDRYPVAVLSGGEGRRWRVRVQPVVGEKRARALAASLKKEEGLPTWVISLGGRGDR